MIAINPELIIKARKDAGLTQPQAANLINSSVRAWQHWEAGDRAMKPAFFELFTIKIAGVKKP